MSISSLSIQLLGGFRVTIDERPVPEDAWRLSAAARLVKLLALAPGFRLHREQLMGSLWPDAELKAASGNLRYALHIARRSLNVEPGGPFLTRVGDQIVLGPTEAVWVDVVAFEAAASFAWSGNDLTAVEDAIALYQGELLPEDASDDWIESRRDALRLGYLSLLGRVGAWADQRGDLSRAIATYQERVSIEPADESAHVALMQLHAQRGDRERALAQYAELVEILEREVDAEPAPATRDLAEAIRASSWPESYASPAPVAPSAQRKVRLPEPLTRLIGREREVTQVRELLGKYRLVTVTGVGGIGKTHLALTAGHDSIDHFPDGVYFVDLAPHRDPDILASAIARDLEVTEEAGQPLLDTLQRNIGERRILLLLDNFEHLLEATPAVAQLLEGCPQLRVLITSRERLRLPGELVYPLAPLGVPGHDRVGLEDVLRFPASELFIERAREVRPELALDQHTAGIIAVICRQLEGIPLALELAASMVERLSLQSLHESLRQRLPTLTEGPRDLPDRQQTLRSTIAWSYNLLPRDAQRLFRALSVFAGGWTEKAAQAVAKDERDVASGLERLVEQHLARRAKGPAGSIRYGMLETIREFGLELLEESRETRGARERHAAYFLYLGEQADPRLESSEQQVWLERLEADNDNIRHALDWLTGRDVDRAVRLAVALHYFWHLRRHHAEGRQWLHDLLRPDVTLSPSQRAGVLNRAGRLAWLSGDHDPAETLKLYQESVKLARRYGSRRSLADSLSGLGVLASNRRDQEQAAKHYYESLAIFRELGDRFRTAVVLHNLAVLFISEAEFAKAKSYLEESLALRREVGDPHQIGAALAIFAWIAVLAGDYRRAEELYDECIDMHRRIGSQGHVANFLYTSGLVVLEQGDRMRAQRLFDQVLGLGFSLNTPMFVTIALGQIGVVAALDGKADQGRRLLEEAVGLARQPPGDEAHLAGALHLHGLVATEAGDGRAALASHHESLELRQYHLGVMTTIESLEGIASALTVLRQLCRAARLFAVAERQRSTLDIPAPPTRRWFYGRHLARVRAHLDGETLVREWERGCAMSIDEAIAEALSGTG